MKRNKYILPLIAIALISTTVQAQTQRKDTAMNRTVVVEQEYAPDIMDAAKVNILPTVDEPSVSKGAVNYATAPAPATHIPATTMQPFMGKESKQSAKPGYVRAGYGNHGNLDLLGNYLFRFTDRDKLNLRLQMDGMDGKLSFGKPGIKDWEAYYYRTQAGVDFIHQFDKLDLNVGGNFGLSNFNHLSIANSNSKQKFTSGDMRLGVASTDETLPFQYSAEASLLYYQRAEDAIGKNLRETQFHSHGFVSVPISDNQRVTVQAEISNFSYKMEKRNNINYAPQDPAYGEPQFGEFENYSLIGLNPYYEWENDSWKLHLGAHTDIGLGKEKGFHFAPDVTAQFLFSDNYILYGKATGGDVLNDFRYLETLSPYAWVAEQPEHTHEHINTTVGFKASPVAGLWFDLFAGYQDTENDLKQGFVGTPLFRNSQETGTWYYNSYLQTNTSNTYAGARLNYGWKDVFTLQTSATFRDWKADNEWALIMAPAFEFNIQADVRPISSLLLNVGYHRINRDKTGNDTQVKIDPVSNLYLRGEYQLFKDMSVYTRLDNLLNKSYSYYLGYPAEGFNFVGGVSLRF